MKWDRNVDFTNRMIIIDVEVMKGRKIHVVPMSNQVYDLLKTMQKMTGHSEFVFSGRNSHKEANI